MPLGARSSPLILPPWCVDHGKIGLEQQHWRQQKRITVYNMLMTQSFTSRTQRTNNPLHLFRPLPGAALYPCRRGRWGVGASGRYLGMAGRNRRSVAYVP
jgi:hypothetical protein